MGTMSEKSLADRWSERVAGSGPVAGPPWLQELGRHAAEQFRLSGLPDRKVEAWKYTPLRLLEQLAPELDSEDAQPAVQATYPDPLSDLAVSVNIPNGRPDADLPAVREGVTLMPFGPGLETFEDRVRPLLEGLKTGGRDKAFSALNTALLRDGLILHVAAGVDAGPVLLRWSFSGEAGRLRQSRVVILLDAGARLELQEQYQSPEPGGGAISIVMHAELAAGSRLSHVRVQNESDSAVVLTSLAVRQEENSIYRHFGFDLGGGLVRHEMDVLLGGAQASTEMSGAFVLDGKRHVDNHVSIDHKSTDCSSEQFYRGVLGGRSRGVFSGRTLIRPGADGSSVKQSNANLLLSPLAEMDTKPELEIYADEVEASHGATVGQLDESAVFYLRTRGLSEVEARRMLTTAFCHAASDRMDDRALAGRIAGLIDQAMPDV